MAKIIVFGNEKGGSGKSTTAMHVAIALCYQNKNVGVIDLDIRQKSMFRFLENRSDFCRKQKSDLPRPSFYKIDQSNKDSKAFLSSHKVTSSSLSFRFSKLTKLEINQSIFKYLS